jgi:hypothetical protein
MTTNTSHKKRWLMISGGLVLLVTFITFVDFDRVFELLRDTNWILWFTGSVLLLAGTWALSQTKIKFSQLRRAARAHPGRTQKTTADIRNEGTSSPGETL